MTRNAASERWFVGVLATAMLFASACGASDQRGSAQSSSTADGEPSPAATLLGADRTLRESLAEWNNARMLSITPMQRWCTSADASGCDLRDMAHAIALPDGGVVVADVMGPIHRFAAETGFVGPLARQGSGPGEYRMMVDLVLDNADGGPPRLLWFDMPQLRLASVGLDGEPGPTTPLQPPMSLMSIDILRGELVVTDMAPADAVGDTVDAVFRTVPASGEPRELGRVRTPSLFTPGTNMFAPPAFFTPQVLYGVGWSGDIAHTNGSAYDVRVFPDGGDPWRIIIEQPEREVSPQERDSVEALLLARMKAERVADLPESQRERLARTGRTMPPLSMLRVLRDGTLWIRPTPPRDAAEARWDVFAPSGQRIGQASLPLSGVITDGERDWILVVERGEDDVPTLVRYAVGR
jgi:hypothetical protein